jgi:hypothetical protein
MQHGCVCPLYVLVVVICYGRGMLQGASRHSQIRRRVHTRGKRSVIRRFEQNVRFGVSNNKERIRDTGYL